MKNVKNWKTIKVVFINRCCSIGFEHLIALKKWCIENQINVDLTTCNGSHSRTSKYLTDNEISALKNGAYMIINEQKIKASDWKNAINTSIWQEEIQHG